jgi:hypothetical protein
LPVSLAIGWKSFQPGNQMDDLIEGADRMLYSNKGATKKSDPAMHPVESGL